MASEKQILANQENAKKSTGPRTQVGKDMARRNAMKNGLRSMGYVLPEHIANEISEHTDWIHSALKADNPFEIALEETLGHAMVMVAETNRCLVARRLAIALRAQEFWDDDQLAKWAEVAETLTHQTRRDCAPDAQ